VGRKKLRLVGIILGVIVLVGMLGGCASTSTSMRATATYTPTPEITFAPTETEPESLGVDGITPEINDWLAAVVNDATVSPTASAEYATLRSGDSNDDVRSLQTRLIELGFLTATADGDYGSKTVSAVKKAQALAGLEVTGVADSETQRALWAYDAPTAQPQPTKIKTTPTPEPEEDYGLDSGEEDYIANKNTHVFHYPWCSSVDQMKEKNKWYFTGSRETLIKKGYRPCKRCDP